MGDRRSFLESSLRKIPGKPGAYVQRGLSALETVRQAAPPIPRRLVPKSLSPTEAAPPPPPPPPPAYHENVSYQPPKVELLPRNHPLAKRMMCCASCQRIIYPGEEFRVCLECPPMFSLCSRDKCAAFSHGNHPMTLARIVLETELKGDAQAKCPFCYRANMTNSWIDCGSCDAQRCCVDCHAMVKSAAHQPYCQKQVADITFVIPKDITGIARLEDLSPQVWSCFECGIGISLNEIRYNCFGCEDRKIDYTICFHCITQHRNGRKSLPQHANSHQPDFFEITMLIDPSTRHSGRLNETWQCEGCKKDLEINEERVVCEACNSVTCGDGDCTWKQCFKCPRETVRKSGLRVLSTERKAAFRRKTVAPCESCSGPISVAEGFYRCKPCFQSNPSHAQISTIPRGIFCYKCYEGKGTVANRHLATHLAGSNYWCVSVKAVDWELEKVDWAFDCQGGCGNQYRQTVSRITSHNSALDALWVTCLPCFWSSGISPAFPPEFPDRVDYIWLRVYLGIPPEVLALPSILESAAQKNERLTKELADMKLSNKAKTFSKSLFKLPSSKSDKSKNESSSKPKEKKKEPQKHPPHAHKPHHKKHKGPGEEEEEGGGDAGDGSGGGGNDLSWGGVFADFMGAIATGMAEAAASSSNSGQGQANSGGYTNSGMQNDWGVYGNSGNTGNNGYGYDNSGMTSFASFDYSGMNNGFGGMDYGGGNGFAFSSGMGFDMGGGGGW